MGTTNSNMHDDDLCVCVHRKRYTNTFTYTEMHIYTCTHEYL